MIFQSHIKQVLFVGLWISNFIFPCVTVLAQEEQTGKIRKKMGDLRVESLQDQIRQIKRSLSILGPKHPNWELTNRKLKDLEAKLDEILNPLSLEPSEKQDPDSKQKSSNGSKQVVPVPMDPIRNSNRGPEKSTPIELPKTDKIKSEANTAKSQGGVTDFPKSAPESDWIYQTCAQSEKSPYIGYSNTPKIVQDSRGLPEKWNLRFSQEAMRGIHHIGFVPGSNRLYGIEFDSVIGISSVWGWDYSDESSKSLLVRLEGEVLDFLIAHQTGESMLCYILRRENVEPTRIELLEVDLPKKPDSNKAFLGNKLLATLTPDFASPGRIGHHFYFSEGFEDSLMVLSDTGFTSTIGQDSVRCAQLDPLSMIFWTSDQSPDIQRLRRLWIGLSGSNKKNERVVLISDGQIVLHRSQGTKSCFLIKGRDGKLLREVLAAELNLDALSVTGISRIFTHKAFKKTHEDQDLFFLADNQASIFRTQDIGIPTSARKDIAGYEGRVLQFTKDIKDRFLMLTEDGVMELTSIDYLTSDVKNGSSLSLAETGLFKDDSSLQPREFFLEYYPKVSSGVHGGNSRYFVAFPKGESIKDVGRQGWLFPEGSIFLQMPSADRHRGLNHKFRSESIHISFKSNGRWRYCNYPLEIDPSSRLNSVIERTGDDSIGKSGGFSVIENRNCWKCHSKSFNDGIQSFHDTVLNQVSPSGVLQSEYLRQVRLLTRQDQLVGAVVPNPPTQETAQQLSHLLAIVTRIQALAPNWYGRQLRPLHSSFSSQIVLNENDRLLGIDALIVTGDERYRSFLIDDGWWEHTQYYISEWLTSVTAAEFDESLAGDPNLDLRPLNHIAMLIGTLPETKRADVHRLFSKAALVFMNARNSRSFYPPSSYSSDIRRYTTSGSFDAVWTDLLLEYYGSVGAPWALQEAKEFLDGFTIPKEVSVVIQSDRVKMLRNCLLSLRAFELTGDSQFLKNPKEVWVFLHSLAPTLEASPEELVLKAHCALRFLSLDVDAVATQQCLRALSSFESLLSASGLAGSQKESSIEPPIDKLIISKALIESKRIIPELMLCRRTQIVR